MPTEFASLSKTVGCPQEPSPAETVQPCLFDIVVPDIHTPYDFYERIYLNA